MRAAGVLLPISALPSKYGIGSFSKEAYDFVDFLNDSGQRVWQLLPIGPTGVSNSPYQPLSAFAGNPYYICLEDLVEEGYLTSTEVNQAYYGDNEEKIDYGAVYDTHPRLLKEASKRFFEQKEQQKSEYTGFVKRNSYWLPDYALYMSLKDIHNASPWTDWEEGLKNRNEEAICEAELQNQEAIVYFYFEQYMFWKQIRKLNEYALSRGVHIINSMPFFVGHDSADVWANQKFFRLLESGHAGRVGAEHPSDIYPKGIKFLDPAYNWEALESDGYKWWLERIKHNSIAGGRLVIDNFSRFAESYEVSGGAEDATGGIYERGSSPDFVNRVAELAGIEGIIAEDINKDAALEKKLMEEGGYFDVRILENAFYGSADNRNLTHNHTKNCVVYTGTQDEAPLKSYLESLPPDDMFRLRKYIRSMDGDTGKLTWDFIREAYRSPADLCIVRMQDYLVLGEDTRFHDLRGSGRNWTWRLKKDAMSADLRSSIKSLTEEFYRNK